MSVSKTIIVQSKNVRLNNAKSIGKMARKIADSLPDDTTDRQAESETPQDELTFPRYDIAQHPILEVRSATSLLHVSVVQLILNDG